MVILRTAILLLFFSQFFLSRAQTIINGGTASGIWNAEGNPYLIEGNVYVGPDDRLTIKEGVEVLFTGDFIIQVVGRFEVNGTAQSPVLFSLEDTTGVGGGINGWQGIVFSGPGPTGGEFSTMQHSIVEFASSHGIAVYDYTQLTLSNITVQSNSGYGLVLGQFSNIQVTKLKSKMNLAGGLKIDMSRPEITDFLIEDNAGPGISIHGGWFGSQPVMLSQGEIRNNINTGNGGGLSIQYDNSVKLKDLVIHQNESFLGGGIHGEQSNISLENVSIRSNNALQGAGIYSGSGNELEMVHSVISENQALEAGGGMFITGSEWYIERCTFADNTAEVYGGGIAVSGSSTPGLITSSILWDNLPDAINAQGTLPIVEYSDIEGGYAGLNNIDADPMFENGEMGMYQLTWSDYPLANDTRSPCIDAGNPQGSIDPDGTIPDMGAYYYFQATITGMSEVSEIVFTLFPNPAGNQVRIRTEEAINQIQLLNLSGQLVREASVSPGSDRIDLEGVPTGIYLVKIIGANGMVATKKLIKE
jgi:predicted outer membrane repeat protein